MNLHTTRAAILPIVQRVATTDGINKQNPIARVTARAASIWIRSVGQESTHEGTAACTVNNEGQVDVDAKMLASAIGSLPNGVVSMALDKSHVLITGGGAKLKIPIVLDHDPIAPDLGDVQALTVDGKRFAQTIGRVRATMFDGHRDNGGAHLESFDGYVRLVTTDRHRLSRAQCPAVETIRWDGGSLIPSAALDGIVAIVGDTPGTIELAFGNGWVRATCGSMVSHWRMMNGQFPDYETIIPSTFKCDVTMHRASWVDALKRANSICGVAGAARHRFDANGCAIDARDSDGRELEEDIAAKVNGANITVGFNPKYLMDALEAHGGEQITFRIAGERAPAKIETDDALWIVMPRVQP